MSSREKGRRERERDGYIFAVVRGHHGVDGEPYPVVWAVEGVGAGHPGWAFEERSANLGSTCSSVARGKHRDGSGLLFPGDVLCCLRVSSPEQVLYGFIETKK